MKKSLFGKEYELQKFVKDDQDWLHWEMLESNFSNLFKEIEKQTGKKPDIQNEFEILKQNYEKGKNLKSERDNCFVDLKKFLDEFTAEKYGFAYGSETKNNKQWFNITTSLSNKVTNLTRPIYQINDQLFYISEDTQKQIDSISTKLGTEVINSYICPHLNICEEELIEYNAKKMGRYNFMLDFAKLIVDSSENALTGIGFEIKRYQEEYSALNQEKNKLCDEMDQTIANIINQTQQKVFSLFNEIQSIKNKENNSNAQFKIMQLESELSQVKRQKESDILAITLQKESEIKQLEREILNLKENHDKEVKNLKETQIEKIQEIVRNYDTQGQALKTEIERISNELAKQEKVNAGLNTEINGLKSDNKTLKLENEKQDKELYRQKIFNKIQTGGIAVLGAGLTIVASAVFGPQISEHFENKKLKQLNPPTIEQKYEQSKLDTLIIHEKKDTVMFDTVR